MNFRFVLVFTLTAFVLLKSARSADVPTVVPVSPFDPFVDARSLYNAIAGWGTNEATIINTLCYRPFAQRYEIAQTYFTLYGHSLESDLIGDLGGQFKDLMVSMTHSLPDYNAIELHKILSPLGTDEKSLLEVLISKNRNEMASIRDSYYQYYAVTLISAIESDTSGAEKTILVSLAQGNRDDSTSVDEDSVLADVDSLYLAGANSTGTSQNVFINIFTTRNFAHLRRVFEVYEAQFGQGLETVIESEFEGATRELMAAIMQYTRDKYRYFAQRFYGTLSVIGTLDIDLMRLTVSRCEVDLGNIKPAYEQLYGKTLRDAVYSDTSGDYRTALLAMIA